MFVWEQLQTDRSEHVREAALCSPRAVKQQQERPQVLEQRFPGRPWVKTMVSQTVPLWSVEVQGEDTHLEPLETPHAKGGCSKEAGTLWEACAGGCSWQDLWTMEREAQAEACLLPGHVTPQGTPAGAVCS